MSFISSAINWVSLIFSVCIVLSSLVFAYVLLVPIDVLESWRISAKDQVYKPGESITLESSYVKAMDVNGSVYYYLECENGGRLARYPLSQSEGNRSAGRGDVEITLRLPSSIPKLPAQCRIAVSVDYKIYTFRTFTEKTESNWFKVEEK